jgi:uncharacterized protein (UPF0332 family)
MTGRDFLSLAARLASGTEEADWRTAVSRAYYAAFHTARSLLTELGFAVPREERAHKYLSFRFSNAQVGRAARVGLDLDNLRTERNRADYDLDDPFDAADALQQVQIAQQMLQALDALGNEPERTALTDAIKTYERTVLGVVTWRVRP